MKRLKIVNFLKGRVFLMLALLAILLLITYFVAPHSYTLANLKQILNNLSYITIIAVGVACLMLSGGIDFSTSAHASFGMVIFAFILQKWPNLPWGIAVIAMLLIGACAGGINAFLTEGLKMMAFICTIGMQSVWNGIGAWITAGNIVAITRKSFTDLATYYVLDVIPVLFIFAVAIVVIYNIVITGTRFGRSVAMVGGNPTAARLAGINPTKVRSAMFVNNGVLAALGALVWAAQQKQGSPTGLTGSSPEMTALTATMLGGVAFGGGSGTLGGAFLGVVLITTLSYALQAMNVTVWLLTLINGSLLVIALTIDRFTNKTGAVGGMPGMS